MDNNYDIANLNDKYTLIQSKSGFRFSTDAVVLSDFVGDAHGKKVLDIGTGNGILPVILFMKDKIDNITAIDIQAESISLARDNMVANNIADRVEVIHGDVRECKLGNTFDVIVSNPPYMTLDGKLTNDEMSKTIARHEVMLSLDEFARHSKRLLKSIGKLTFVHRAYRTQEILDTLTKYELNVSRMKFVHYDNDSDASLVLIEALKGVKRELHVETPIIISGSKYIKNTDN